MKNIFITTLSLLVITVPCFAKEKVYTDIFTATVVSVYDGDTITVNLDALPAVFSDNLGIRVYGVDTPEMKGSDKAKAILARDFVRSQCKIGDKVKLSNIRRDKYFRLDADIECSGKNIGEELLKKGMGKPYFGGTKK